MSGSCVNFVVIAKARLRSSSRLARSGLAAVWRAIDLSSGQQRSKP